MKYRLNMTAAKMSEKNMATMKAKVGMEAHFRQQ